MTQGDIIEFDGQQLIALSNPNSSCQRLPLSCALHLGGFACRGIEIKGYIPCKGHDVTFLTREQYLEHRLMSEA